MPRFRVGVTSADVTQGAGPALVTASDPEAAKVAFAAGEGTTVEGLADAGLTWWQVDEVPA